jgi:hypothetical protein
MVPDFATGGSSKAVARGPVDAFYGGTKAEESSLLSLRSQIRAGLWDSEVRQENQCPLTLTLDRVFVGHECDYCAFHGLRLSFPGGRPDILNAACGALG